MGTLSGETIPFSICQVSQWELTLYRKEFAPGFSMGVNSYRKKFAPRRNLLLASQWESTLIGKNLLLEEICSWLLNGSQLL